MATMSSPSFSPALAAGISDSSSVTVIGWSGTHPTLAYCSVPSGCGWTCFSRIWFPRWMATSTGCRVLTMTFSITSSQVGFCSPSMRTMRSPCSIPAFEAGEFSDHPSNDRRLLEENRVFVVHHEHDGKESDSQENVHRRPGDGNHEALPARMRHEFVGRAAARFQRVLARHLDVAAERQGADAVVGVAAAKTSQTFTEADGENIDPNAKPFGGGKVAELVHQDHDAEHDGHRNHRNQKRFHITLYLGSYLCRVAEGVWATTSLRPTCWMRLRALRRASASILQYI